MNSRRYDMAYAADTNGYAYVFGGIGNNNAVLATVERYDRISNTWTFMASMPAARCQFGAAFDGSNNILYVPAAAGQEYLFRQTDPFEQYNVAERQNSDTA